MKLEIDYKQKEFKILEDINFLELQEYLNSHGIEFRDYTIKVNVQYITYPPLNPIPPYPPYYEGTFCNTSQK